MKELSVALNTSHENFKVASQILKKYFLYESAADEI